MIKQPTNRVADKLRSACLLSLALMFASPFCAEAQNGTITFVGAVVAPTCQAPAPTPSAQRMSGSFADQSCGSAGAGTTRSYRLSTTPISANADDRVLNYFYRYTMSSTDTKQAPELMTLEYE